MAIVRQGLGCVLAALSLVAATGCHGRGQAPPVAERVATSTAALSGDGGSDAGSTAGCGVSLASNFNGTAIGSGATIWFSSVAKFEGVGSQPVHLSLRGGTVRFTASGITYTTAVPDADVTIDPSATTASTQWSTALNRWVTTVPKQFSGNAFLTGLAYAVPGNLPGGVQPVTWQGSIESDTPGVTVQWQWAAAAYTSFGAYAALGVVPVDDNHYTGTSDHAGTPEAYKSHVTGGATGGGGSNYTGSLSGTLAVTPSTAGACEVAAPTIGSFGVYATQAVELDANSLVTGCGVGVEYATGPFLFGGVAAYLNSSAVIDSHQTLYADSVFLNSGANVGAIDANHLASQGGTYGAVAPLPAMPAAPTMPSATAGTQNVQLNSGTQTLAPGAYGSVLVGAGATLTLTGGSYVFSSLTLNSNATLTVSAPTTLSVTGASTFGTGCYVGPASGSGLTAKAFVLYLDSSSNVNLNSSAWVQALLVATNAEVIVNTSKFYGAIAASQVLLNSGATVTCQDGFGALSCAGGCDDGNACTADACSGGTCTHTAVANGTACNDGNACDLNDTCQAGMCTAGGHVTCAASDQCHVAGTCNPSTGQCSNPTATDGTACNDGNACDLNDTCKAGTCTAGSHVTCTASDSCHVAGTCNPSTGQCSNPTATDGTACNDGNACDLNDTCQAGACTAGGHVVCAASDQCHVVGTCNPSTGQCSNPTATDGTACNDGNACDLNDACKAGTCTAGSHVTCTASDQCHVAGACNPSTGQCSNPTATDGTACNDGNACDLNDTCKTGVCTAGSQVNCSASDQCHVAGACNPTTGQCSNPAAADGTTCNDGNACTQSDACLAGACAGSNPITCTASDQCHSAGTCDPSSGVCSNPAVSNGTACNDGNPCDTSVSCQAGVCTAGGTVACAPLDACHAAGTCDPSTGACSNPLKPSCPPGLPPDPATVAPPLDRTVVSTVYAQTQFLWSAPSPDLLVQTGVAPGTISQTRVCEVYGHVQLDDGSPAPGAVITVVAHPEYGQTMSRQDGNFNLVLNGGEAVTVDYRASGYLPTQRTVTCPWQNFAQVPTVILVPPDPNVTTIALGASTYQVAKGSVETDSDGTRRGVVLVPPNTTASALLPCGTSTPLTSMSVRITEYTVGPNGPQRMPASLPPTSAYTYAFETSADEAEAMGAVDVTFNQPVAYYNENFMQYPVGTEIPLGSYASHTSAGACTSGSCSGWTPQNNGIILAITSVAGGSAAIDVTGDGVADPASELATFGITAGEQQTLAGLYAAGTQLWRVQLPHFSIWDSNWGFSPPNDASAPQATLPTIDVLAKCTSPAGSGPSVDAVSQTATVKQPIVGTPYNLVYDSQRVDGRTAARAITIPLTGASVPADAVGVSLSVTVAGNTFTKSFSPAPNLSYTYEWNGVDAFGRPLQGAQPVSIDIGFVYSGVIGTGPFQSVPNFGHTGNGHYVVGNRTRRQVTLPTTIALEPPAFSEEPLGLGGWNIDVHHAYDMSGNVYLGDGTTRVGAQVPQVVSIIGDPVHGGAPPLCSVGSTAVAADGSVYIHDYFCGAIYRMSPPGTFTRVAGTGTAGYNGDEIPATQAQIGNRDGKIVMARECDGGFYFVDYANARVRYVDGHGTIHTIVGNGQTPNIFNAPQDGVQATQLIAGQINGLALASDGSFYVSLQSAPNCHNIRGGAIIRVDLTGVETQITGCTGDFLSEHVPASQIGFINPGPIATAPDDSVYFADNSAGGNACVRVIRPNGVVSTLAGAGRSITRPIPADGTPLLDANLEPIPDIAVDANGVVYFLDVGDAPSEVFSIPPGGVALHAVAGGGSLTYPAGIGSSPLQLGLSPYISGISIAPDATLYLSDYGFINLIRVQPVAFPGLGPSQFQIPSQDGRELFVFDANGRHLSTLDALTGATRFAFTYDAKDRLASVSDATGHATTVQRDGSGAPISITSPYGQVTALATDPTGYLATITNPNEEKVSMTYSSAQPGLLVSLRDAAGNVTGLSYDAEGRVAHVANPAGGGFTYAPTDVSGTSTSSAGLLHVVGQTSSLGVATSYQQQSTLDGDARTTVLPSGVQASQLVGLSGNTRTTLPSGTQTTVTTAPDPRFGITAPIAATIVTTSPAGLAFTQDTASSATLSVPGNLSSLTTLTNVVTVDPTASERYSSTYTASSRTWSMTTAQGRSRTLAMDALGRLASSQTDSLTPSAFAYDAFGRLASLTQGARVRSYAYDGSGMLASVTDPANEVTGYRRDGAGRVTAQTLADGTSVAFAYDGAGHVDSMTTPGGATHAFTHSPIGLLASYTAPAVQGSGSTTSYVYDVDGRLTSYVRPDGENVALARDAAGRIETVTMPTGELVVGYDTKTGRPAVAAGPGNEAVSYAYDGNLTTQIAWSGPVEGQVSWAYDKSMKVVSETAAGSGISYAYDNDGVLTGLGRMSLTANGAGLVTATALGTVTDAITYDAFGARASYTAKAGASTLFSAVYTRDALGRIATKTETVQGATHTYAYVYDARGRLTQVTKDGAATGYGYDANGNRTSTTSGATSTSATYDAQDRLTAFGSASYTYGASGEVASKTDATGVTTYTYDALGNLVQVNLPHGVVVQYTLDAAGRRVGKSINGKPVAAWLYRDSYRPVAELDPAGGLVTRFVYADNAVADQSVLQSLDDRLGLSAGSSVPAGSVTAPAYVVQNGQTLRIVADHLGSVRLVVNTATGAVVEALDYDAFGNVISATGPNLPSLTFAGGLFDANTNLVHFGARDYDPQTGRWMSKEPIKTSGTLNFYQYAGGDPINALDPTGLAASPSPEKQVILDSICGPNAQGEVICLASSPEALVEGALAANGSATGTPSDTTTSPTPSTDLPTLVGDGNGELLSEGWVDLGATSSPANPPPSVSVGPSSTITTSLPAVNVPLPGSVTTTGPFPVTAVWNEQSGPAPVVFGNQYAASTTATFPAAGIYVLVLTGGALEQQANATITVTVLGAPLLQVSAPPRAPLGATLDPSTAPIIAAQVTEPLPGHTVTLTWSVVSGPGTVTFAAPSATIPAGGPTVTTTTAEFTAIGKYVLQATATDGTYVATAPLSILIDDPYPLLTGGLDQVLPGPGTAIVSATAYSFVPERPLVLAWTQLSGPAPVTIDSPNSATTNVYLPVAGDYVLQVAANDSALTSTSSLRITVLGTSTGGSGAAPSVQLTGPASVALGDPSLPVYVAQVTEPLPGHTAAVTWSAVSGPGTVTFGTPAGSVPYGATTVVSTTAQFSAAGSYVLAATATDGTYTTVASQSVTVSVDQPPTISTSGDQTLSAPGSTTVSINAAGSVPSLPLSYVWTQVTGPAATIASPTQASTAVTLPAPGVYVFQASVNDTLLTSTATLTITVSPPPPPPPPPPPTGPAPAAPLIGGIVDDGVVTQPTVLTGTFPDAQWTLQYRLGGRDDVTTPFTTLASGTGAMSGGTLGTFDPTLLLNGMYTVQLTVTTTGGSSTTSVAVAVDGRMKVGNFTLAFTDLEVPVAGLPIQLIRTYDSRDKGVGDFGVGWNLSIRDVRVEKSGKTGAYWQVLQVADDFFPQFCLQPSQSSTVTITFPSGREYRFTPQSQCSYLVVPDPQNIDWKCTSDPNNPTIHLTASGSTSLSVYNESQLVNLSDGQPWDPRQFTFTNELGQTFQISQDIGVTSMQDRHGNTLSITQEGIFSSLGPSVPFVRDAKGRITSITDPNGQTMAYAYDGSGDLFSYTDREKNVTTFTYADSHYLQEIQDPLGRHPIRCDYDTSGRLLDEVDANGKQVTFTTNLAANQQQVADRLGRVTTYTYNLNGDITQKVDPTGATWSYTIDSFGNVLTSTDPLGHVTTSTYDGANNLLTRKDPLGLTTTYTYNPFRQNLTTTDPLGHTTTNVYDASGNLTSTTDALGNVTSYGYDFAGNRTSMADPLGNVTTYAYDGAGHLTNEKDALGHVTYSTYDGNGMKLAQTQTRTNAAGGTDFLVTSYVYDGNGRVLSTAYPDATGTGSSGSISSGTAEPIPCTGDAATFQRTDTTTQGNWIGTYGADADYMDTETFTTPPYGSVTFSGTTNFSWAQGTADVRALEVPPPQSARWATTWYTSTSETFGVSTTDHFQHTVAFYFLDWDANGRAQSVTAQTAGGTVLDAARGFSGFSGGQYAVYTICGSVNFTVTHTGGLNAVVSGIFLSTPGESAGRPYTGFGGVRSTTYTATGKVATTTDELGRTTSYAYDALDRLITTTRPDLTTTSQAYDAENERTSSTDAAGFTTTYQYDGAGRLTTTTHPDNTSSTTTYDAAGRATDVKDEAGFTSSTGYDVDGRVTTQKDALGNVTTYAYDDAGNQTSTVDPLGHTTTTTYDADNRRLRTTYADATFDSVGYDGAGRMTTKTDQLGHTTSYGYDALGRLASVTDALGEITAYAYDEIGERISQTDANGHLTAFGYDARGRQNLRRLPDGSAETMSYDAAGEKTSRVDFNGKVTQYGYDTLGRLTSRTYAADTTQNVSFTYTPDGLRATAVDARGTTSYGYDNRRRVTSMTYPNGNQLGYGYDARGLRTSIATTIGTQTLTTSTTYDADGRASSVQDPLGRSFGLGYDAASRRTQLAYPNTTATSYGYDVNNRLTQITTTQTPTNGAPLTVQSFGYNLDAEGKRTQVVEADGTVRQFGYDSIDRLTSEIVSGPLTYGKAFAYDPVGNRTTQTTTGTGAGTVPYTYDSRDRMLTSDGSSYTYDTNGNELTKSTEATYAYDLENRQTQVTLHGGGSAAHTYDVDGNRVKTVEAPSIACSGNTASFVKQDGATQGNWVGAYGKDGYYIANGATQAPAYGSVTGTNVSTFTWASSTTDVRALEAPPPSSARSATTYYASTTETFHVVTSDGFAHQVAFYLLDWDNSGRQETLTAQTATGGVLDGARAFDSIGGGVWATYTVCGSVDFVVTHTAGLNAVVSGVFFGTPVGAGTTNYVVDGSGGLSQVVAETDGSGNLTAHYVRAGGQLLAIMRPGGSGGMWTTRFVHADGLGSVRTITDETGAVVDARGYEAFGTKNVEAGSDPLAYGFAGEAFDSATHLAYHRARWMDARVGRFVGMDPTSGSPDGWLKHGYAYGNNSPATMIDPTGLEGVDAEDHFAKEFLGLAGRSIGNGGSGPPYNGIEYPDQASATFAAFGIAKAKSITSTTYDPGSGAMSATPLHPEWGGDVFFLPNRGKYGIDVYTDGWGGALNPWKGIKRLPANAQATVFFHTHPNDDYYTTVGGDHMEWNPQNWSCQDVVFRNRLFGSGLLSFEVDLLAYSSGAKFFGIPLSSPHWEESHWPSWASGPDRFTVSDAPRLGGKCE